MKENRRRYSQSYMQKIVYAVRMWLYANGIEVPGELLRMRYRVRFKYGKTRDSPPAQDELEQILNAAKQPYRAISSFLSATGMRPAEALILRIGDLKPHPHLRHREGRNNNSLRTARSDEEGVRIRNILPP